MSLDLERMLEKCTHGQWNVDDFDWNGQPITLSPAREREVCAYYVNMSYIERLAGALFLSLARRVDDPTLAGIFTSFHADELRHSHAAARLADYFDVHHYQLYTPNIAMLRFMHAFVRMAESLHPAYATSLMLGGELILDIALLRGLNDYVADPLSQAVVERINQDESRHLAMDVFMTEYLAHPERGLAARPKNPWLHEAYWGVLTWAPDFFTEVFFRPMQALDPSQEHMREAMRRLRRLYDRPQVAGNPAVHQFQSFVTFFERTVGSWIGGAFVETIRRVFAVDPSFAYARG